MKAKRKSETEGESITSSNEGEEAGEKEKRAKHRKSETSGEKLFPFFLCVLVLNETCTSGPPLATHHSCHESWLPQAAHPSRFQYVLSKSQFEF
jgi:hypothetical protein